MAIMSPENISGFVVGEGCFYVESGYDKKYRFKHRIRLAFCIEVKSEDKEILEEIQKKINCGNIYCLDFGRYKGYEQKKWKPHVKYRVSNQKDIIEKVIPFFEKYPLFGTKLKSFSVFKEIAARINASQHKTEEGLKELIALANDLKTINKKGI